MRIKKVSQTAGLVGSVVNSQSESNSDTYSCNYINSIVNGDVLWENGNLANGWDEYPVPVDLSNYQYVAIEFVYNTGNTNTYKIEKVKVGNNITGTIQWIGSGGVEIMSRNFVVSSSQVNIKKGYTNSNVDRTALIPSKIIGYK